MDKNSLSPSGIAREVSLESPRRDGEMSASSIKSNVTPKTKPKAAPKKRDSSAKVPSCRRTSPRDNEKEIARLEIRSNFRSLCRSPLKLVARARYVKIHAEMIAKETIQTVEDVLRTGPHMEEVMAIKAHGVNTLRLDLIDIDTVLPGKGIPGRLEGNLLHRGRLKNARSLQN